MESKNTNKLLEEKDKLEQDLLNSRDDLEYAENIIKIFKNNSDLIMSMESEKIENRNEEIKKLWTRTKRFITNGLKKEQKIKEKEND